MDCSLLGFSVHTIFQAGRLEWTAISFSRESSQSRDWTHVSCVPCIGEWILYHQCHHMLLQLVGKLSTSLRWCISAGNSAELGGNMVSEWSPDSRMSWKLFKNADAQASFLWICFGGLGVRFREPIFLISFPRGVLWPVLGIITVFFLTWVGQYKAAASDCFDLEGVRFAHVCRSEMAVGT